MSCVVCRIGELERGLEMTNDTDASIQTVRERLEGAKRVFILTGAGVSAESGVPTFRDLDGHWKNIDPMQVATPEAFARDPEFVWGWYDARRQNLAKCKPNPGHEAMAAIEARIPDTFVLTQNVDDLHEQAGTKNIAHIHGSIWVLRSTGDGTEIVDRRAPLPEIPPRDPSGALYRPGVVWFGEMVPHEPMERARDFMNAEPVDLCFVVGTEASFGYIVQLALEARAQGALLVEVNPRQTDLTHHVDVHLEGPSGEILPRVIAS